jgi:hypothetical protein
VRAHINQFFRHNFHLEANVQLSSADDMRETSLALDYMGRNKPTLWFTSVAFRYNWHAKSDQRCANNPHAMIASSLSLQFCALAGD